MKYPEPPPWMADNLRKIWNEEIALLAAPPTGRERVIFETYVETRARYLSAAAALEVSTTVETRNDKGVVVSLGEKPEVKVAERAAAQLSKLAFQLRWK